MKCTRVDMGDGSSVFLCGGRTPRVRCGVPGCSNWHSKLCDYPVKRAPSKSQTCDAKMCDAHTKTVGEGKDYCPPHAKLADRPAQVGLLVMSELGPPKAKR